MPIDFNSFDDAALYEGEDLVYRVRKNGGLKFQSFDVALAVVRSAEEQGYSFSYINRRPWGVYVLDNDN